MRVRLAELVGGLSLATDMGAGQPPQSALTATLLASRLGTLLGLSEAERRTTYYATILRFIGCSSAAPEAAALAAGDDRSFNYALSMADMADPADVERSLERYWAVEADPKTRRRVIRAVVADLGQMAEAASGHCAQAVVLSRRLPLGPDVTQALGHMYDRWDGTASATLAEQNPRPARLSCLAADTAILLRSLGPEMALEIVGSRRGGQFWPEAVDALIRDKGDLLAGLSAPSCWQAYLDQEPGEASFVEGPELERAATAYADFADQRSGFLLGHSRNVATLSFVASESLGLEPETRQRLRLSALLHDIGRAGVATGLWSKPAALSNHERQLVESHNEHTETVLRLAPGLRPLAGPAATAHERADSTGYPRAAALEDQAGALLAAADVYEALTHNRPWRPAYSAQEAADIVLAEARSGKLPRRAAEAVLEAAGHATRRRGGVYPAGLSRREVGVLALLGQGASTKRIAESLGIAVKTAENHVSRIYDKTGVRGRAAIALYAVKHGLHVDAPTPEELS